MTQCDRVLALLRQYGDKGLNTVDLHAPAIDGGKPILRLAARIRDLQDRGYRIVSERKMNNTASYRLLGEPEAVRDGGEASGGVASPAVSQPPVRAAWRLSGCGCVTSSRFWNWQEDEGE